MIKIIKKDMFLFGLAYQNHIYNQIAYSWDDIDAGFVKLQMTQSIGQLQRKTASKSDMIYAGPGLYP